MGCKAPTITVGGVTMSTSDFENAKDLIDNVSSDGGDPTLDEYTENIAGGNNSTGTTGIQLPSDPAEKLPVQTSLPTPSPIPADGSNDVAPPGGNGTQVVGIAWTPGDYDAQLSPNFRVRAFTVNAYFPNELTDYDATYTAQIRFNNLRGLAVNVAEPLLAKFGKFRINSGIRNKTSTPTGISQHITGQACDIQFEGWSYDRYWDNAAWIKDNIQYDQFIYEHSDKTGLVWYHLSFNNAGNRSPDHKAPSGKLDKVLTMYRNHYDQGLKRYNPT